MKAMLHLLGASDRIATREELCQVVDLLERITAAQGLGSSQTSEFPLVSVARGTSADSGGLWLDRAEDDASAPAQDQSLESLAELFADRSDLVN